MGEERKMKIAEKYHVAKYAKDKAQKNDLKKEELYLFHRLLSSHLSEEVHKHRNESFNKNEVVKNEVEDNVKIEQPLDYNVNDIFLNDDRL